MSCSVNLWLQAFPCSVAIYSYTIIHQQMFTFPLLLGTRRTTKGHYRDNGQQCKFINLEWTIKHATHNSQWCHKPDNYSCETPAVANNLHFLSVLGTNNELCLVNMKRVPQSWNFKLKVLGHENTNITLYMDRKSCQFKDCFHIRNPLSGTESVSV